MKLLLFGTGPFAVPAFTALIQSSHQVLGLITRPVEDAGKRRKTAENPTRDLAQQAGLTIHAPVDVNAADSIELLRSFQSDLFVVCDYGQILSAPCLATARLGGINLHGSLLPKYRGAAPIHWAIYHGEQTTGISVIHMTSRLDGGPILTTASLPIAADDTTESLEPRLAELGVQPVLQAIRLLENWDSTSPLGARQDPALATSARRLKKGDGQIDWSRSAAQINNQIRAFQPWPGSYTSLSLSQQKQPLRLIVQKGTVLASDECPPCSELNPADLAPGTIVGCDKRQLIVQTGDGCLALQVVQPAGKRSMDIAEFLRGQHLAVGMRLE